MTNITNLLARSKELEVEILKLKQIISDSPEGRLIIRKSRSSTGRDIYAKTIVLPDGNVKEIYIPKANQQEAVKLATKMWAKKRIEDLCKEKKIIDRLIRFRSNKTMEAQFLETHESIRRLLNASSKINNNKMLAWKNAPYRRNQKYPEKLIFSTVVPELKVRSKAEADIVSCLERYEIPYHYEEIQTIEGVDIAVDFTCINVTSGKKWYWDHRGMLDTPQYIQKTLNTESLFLKAGIIPWINLIVTTETKDHPLDIQWVEKIVQYYLL